MALEAVGDKARDQSDGEIKSRKCRYGDQATVPAYLVLDRSCQLR